jgi:hypothetical protein
MKQSQLSFTIPAKFFPKECQKEEGSSPFPFVIKGLHKIPNRAKPAYKSRLLGSFKKFNKPMVK